MLPPAQPRTPTHPVNRPLCALDPASRVLRPQDAFVVLGIEPACKVDHHCRMGSICLAMNVNGLVAVLSWVALHFPCCESWRVC